MSSSDFNWAPVTGDAHEVPDFDGGGSTQGAVVRQTLSWLPVIVAGVALVVSGGLAFFSSAGPSILGYILTPFVVVSCLAWTRHQHLTRLANPLYDREAAKTVLRVLQVMAAVSFVICIPHAIHIARVVALWLE